MVNEVKKKVLKKGKKIEGVKSKLKIREIKGKIKVKKDSNLEEEALASSEDSEKEISNGDFKEFFQPSVERINPVLGRVAIAKESIDLEHELSNVQARKVQGTERENEINYIEAREDKEEPKYSDFNTDYSLVNIGDEEHEETRRWVAGGELDQIRKDANSGLRPSSDEEKETRKYIGEGDVK